MKKIIRDYFIFTRKERIAVLVLLVLMAAFIGAPYLYEPRFESPPVSNAQLAELLAGTGADSAGERPVTASNPVSTASTVGLFPFDPNNLDQPGWIKLGIAERTARTILNYRIRGGRFKTAGDLRKIWGLRPADAERLIPYVRIEEALPERVPVTKKEPADRAARKTIPTLDINAAGVEEWKVLPGIGEVLANRIVKYRERLGGFLSVEQVKRTYGISDSVFENISRMLRFNPAGLPRFNVNTATLYELRVKLGIPYAAAKAIVGNRDQRGGYKSLDEVRDAGGLPDSSWQKLLLIGALE